VSSRSYVFSKTSLYWYSLSPFARTAATDCELYIIWLYCSACTHFDTIDWAHSHARLRVQKTISHDNIIIIIWSPHNEGVHRANWHTTYLYTRQYVILYDGNSIMRRSMIKNDAVARAYLQRQFITSHDNNRTHLFYGIDNIDNMIVSIWCRWLPVFLYRSTRYDSTRFVVCYLLMVLGCR